MSSPLVVGIAGGTASGKTTVARKVREALADCRVAFIDQDSYYRDLSDMTLAERREINFDHPDAFDTELLINHLEALRASESIEQPIYDYPTHSRRAETIHVEPRPVIIVEGILVFVNPQMRGLMDLKIFVDTDADIRFIRRLDRDVHERGRTVESVISQYTTTVRPMHLQFVEPSKRYADIIIPEGGFNEVGIDLVTGKIRSFLGARSEQDVITIRSGPSDRGRPELPS